MSHEKQKTKKFEVEIIARNARASVIFMILMALFQVAMLIFCCVGIDVISVWDICYIVGYSCAILLSIITILLVYKLYIKFVTNIKSFKILTLVYSILLTCWAVATSLLDLYGGGLYVVFLTVTMGVSGVMFLKPIQSILLHTISLVVFLGLVVLIPSIKFNPQHLVAVVIFTMIAVSIAYGRYRDRVFEYRARDALVDKNHKLEEMNITLTEYNDVLKEVSTTDKLTGLQNRWALNEVFKHAYDRCVANSKMLSVAMFDLDDFKKVNDTYGHQIGDEVLIGTANIFRQFVSSDYVFRLGGEEFLILFEDKTAAETIAKAEDIRQAVDNAEFSTIRLHLSISAGVFAKVPDSIYNYERYLSIVDSALYAAKQKGKNCVVKAG